jgi:plasmid stabilization system protein ParE
MGWAFYERQQIGLGDDFIESILEDLAELPKYAGIQSTIHGHHRAICSRFPYAIYYLLEGDTLIVKAILDGRRHPMRILRRLANPK